MAKIKNGILGGISGTVGNVVGGRWRGIDYIRSKPTSVKNPNTEAQRNQRSRFRLVVQFLSKIKPLITIGFKNGSRNRTAINHATSVNLREAITGTYPDLEINPEALIVAMGDLQGTSQAEVDLTTPGSATITWLNESGVGNASDQDGVMVLIYNSDKDEVIYKLNGAIREDESMQLVIPASWSGDAVSGYISFRSETGRQVSDSLYLGTENMA